MTESLTAIGLLAEEGSFKPAFNTLWNYRRNRTFIAYSPNTPLSVSIPLIGNLVRR